MVAATDLLWKARRDGDVYNHRGWLHHAAQGKCCVQKDGNPPWNGFGYVVRFANDAHPDIWELSELKLNQFLAHCTYDPKAK